MLGLILRNLVFLQRFAAAWQTIAILCVLSMATPHARPGFVSRDTDGDLNSSLASKEKASNPNEHGTDKDFSKGEIDADVQDIEGDFTDKNVPVETAADLVTQIIHLDDDPNERSLTFRTWFLGKYDSECISVVC